MKAFKMAVDNNIAILLFVLGWELIVRLGLLNTMFIPPLSKVLLTTWNLITAGPLVKHILISLERSMAGFFLLR